AAEATAAAERTGDPVLRWHTAAMYMMTALESGDVKTFHARVDVVNELGRQIGQPAMQWLALIARSLEEQLAGRLDRAEQLAAKALEIGVNNGEPDAFTYYGGSLVAIRFDQGRLGELVDQIEQ